MVLHYNAIDSLGAQSSVGLWVTNNLSSRHEVTIFRLRAVPSPIPSYRAMVGCELATARLHYTYTTVGWVGGEMCTLAWGKGCLLANGSVTEPTCTGTGGRVAASLPPSLHLLHLWRESDTQSLLGRRIALTPDLRRTRPSVPVTTALLNTDNDIAP